MHSGNIENYNFTHGLHRNLISGKWFPLHPHTLGRALTHDEMDYNLLYSQQTVAGWRIFGKNEDLTLSDSELTKSLIFWKISETDIDYSRYVAAGYTAGQYIWITGFTPNPTATPVPPTPTPSFDCSTFIITLSSTSPTIDSCDIFGVNSQGATNTTLDSNTTPVTPTATPVAPTSTPIQPTSTPVSVAPTATPVTPTSTPVTPTATPVLVAPTATPVPSTDPLINSSNVDLEIWYDASDVATITPAGVEGTLVTQWSDKSALAHNATPTGGNAKPLYDEMSINGINSLYFDGTDGMSVSPLGQLANSTEATVFISFSPLLLTNFTLLDSDGDFSVKVDSQGAYNVQVAGGSMQSNQRVDAGAQVFALRYTSDPAQVNSLQGLKLFINSTQQDSSLSITTPTPGGNLGNLNELFIGSTNALDNRYRGYIGEIVVFSRALDQVEIDSVMTNLRTKWSAWTFNSLAFTESGNSAFDNKIRWKNQILSTKEQDPLNTQRDIANGNGTWYTQSAAGTVNNITAYIERIDGGQWNDASELALATNAANVTFTKTLIQSDLIKVDVQYTAVASAQYSRIGLDDANSVW